MTIKRLGAMVRKARVSKEISQVELSGAVGICRSSLISLEQGKQIPRYDKMVKIKKYLGLEVRH